MHHWVPKVGVQSVRSVRFLRGAQSVASEGALSDAGASIVSQLNITFLGITMLRQTHMIHDYANLIQPHFFSPDR